MPMSEACPDLVPPLGDRRPYSPHLARLAGGAAAALLLEYLLQQPEATGDLTPAGITAALGLNPEELGAARRQLRDRDLLHEQLAPDRVRVQGRVNRESLQQRLAAFAQFLGQPPAAVLEPATTDAHFPAPRPQPQIQVAPHYRFVGPWRSPEELEQFQRTLVEHFKQQGARSPADKAFWTIDGLAKGLISPYWDEFAAGQPLGSSQQVQRDWELAPGVPYPAFEEDRIQYYRHRGEPIEAAVARARRDLRDPVQGQDLWDGFLRKCDRLAEEARKAQALGVRTPYLPPAFTERSQPTKHQVMAKLAALDPAPLPPAPEPPPLPPPTNPPKPPLATLRAIYQSPLGRKIVEQQLADHPDWGYRLEAGTVVERESPPEQPNATPRSD